MQPTGIVVICLVAIFFAAVFIWGLWTERKRPSQNATGKQWKPRSEFSSHRDWLGGQNIVKAQDAQFERIHNELRRHCRIGRIALKDKG